MMKMNANKPKMHHASKSAGALLTSLLLLVGVTLVAQYALVLAGVKPPIGLVPAEAQTASEPPPSNGRVSRERLIWLESQLAPAPLLVWSYEGEGDNASGGGGEGDAVAVPPVLDVASASRKEGDGDDAVLVFVASYARQLPDLRNVEVNERKQTFISILVPLVLRANQELMERRAGIIAARRRGDDERIRQWAELYLIRNRDGDIKELGDELLRRVDAIPVSLVIAQSIVESGWGTSRFSRHGNSLFGQWAWAGGEGLQASGDANVVVRTFPSLFDSVRAYMHNLNTHAAYRGFREVRAEGKTQEVDIDLLTQRLVPTLTSYAADGQSYIRKLANIIKSNELLKFNTARLEN